MNNRNHPYFLPKKRNLTILAFAAIFALGITSSALYTQKADTDALEKGMPPLTGDAVVEYLKKDVSLTFFEDAIALADDDDRLNTPMAQTKLTRGGTRDYFGGSVAITGDTTIIGASGFTAGAGMGTAYVFVNGAFSQQLTASDGANGDAFGDQVAVSGDTAIIGAAGDGNSTGSAYIFVRSGSSWTQQQKLTASDGAPNQGFGGAVAIVGNTAMVVGGGSTYVFQRNGATWTESQKLTAMDGAAPALVGSLSMSADTAIMAGVKAYIFVRSGTAWAQQQVLTPANPPAAGALSVAISGNTAFVGSPDVSVTQAAQGAVFVFKRTGAIWTQQQILVAPDAGVSDYFGFSIAVFGEALVVGAPFDNIGANPDQGSAYVFYSCGDEPWTYLQKVVAFDGGNEWEFGSNKDEFGHSVAISVDSVIIGAWTDDAGPTAGQVDHGAAYLMPRSDLPPIPPCEAEIEVNITSDLSDADIQDDVCDVDTGQTGQQCSLRAAIETANAKDGPDEIKFDIPGAGTHTISPINILPAITEKVSIDASTQPGYANSPLIELRGSGQSYGLAFVTGSNDSSVSGFAINRFQASIAFQSGGNKVERCYIGLSPDGAAAGMASEHIAGIDIRGATANNNTIGNTGVLRNVISNNSIGVTILQGATGNKVFGNRIGTNVAGTDPIPNVIGALIDGSSGNRIGDTVVGNGNLISGNLGAGITVNAGSTNNLIARNLIGTNATGTEALANGNGVFIDASNNNLVGNATGEHGNTISGNTTAGVVVKAGSSINGIFGNRIGTNATGTAAIPNQFGVVVDSANGNNIGDMLGPTGNVISGNSTFGVVLQNNAATNRVINNSIGTKAGGAEILPNGDIGVIFTGGAHDNPIEKNVIGGHTLTSGSAGISFTVSAGPNNTITGNFIGVTRNGMAAIPNGFGIVSVADGQIIGSQSNGNIIGHNQKAGIFVASLGGTNPVVENNRIEYNFIGTNGTADIGNEEEGILYEGNVENNPITSNIISGNTRFGIALTDNVSSNLIKGNFIGTNTSGTTAIPNGGGIWIRQARDNIIESNLVSGNSLGILVGTNAGFPQSSLGTEGYRQQGHVSGGGATYTTGNRFFGNTIGLNAARTAAIPGCSIGIAIGENARSNLIGTPTGAYNFISGNTATIGYGIFLGTLAASPSEDSLPQFNTFQRNLVGLGGDLQSTISNKVGFVLLQAAHNTIGGDTDALANIIVASTDEGISLRNGTRENTFLKNFLGVLPPGFGSRSRARSAASPKGSYANGSHGILVENGASGNTLGGETSNAGVVISGNGGNGIRLASNAGTGNRMGANRISNNLLPAIDLGGDGITVNDPTDADVGPNNLQNYPTMTFFISGGNLIVNYQVDSALANSDYGTTGLTVQFYKADGSGAGVISLGSDQYTASDYSNGSPGFKKKNLGNAAALGFAQGDTMTATATDAEGNSSEFTPAVSSAPSAISGTVIYGNAIGSPSPRFVSNVLLSGAGSTNVSTTTAAPGAIAGQYTLMGFGAGSYTVTPTKTGGVNNITSFDAARISQHVAGPPNPQLTGNQLLVADVSGNTAVTSFDAAMIAKFVAGPPYAVPGIGSTATWRFTPTNKNYPSVASSIAGEDYSALLMGEVSGNWSNTGARPARAVESGQWTVNSDSKAEKPITVAVPQIATGDKEIVVPVNVEGIANKGVIAYEFDLRYDPAVMQPLVEPVDVKGTVSRGLSVVTNPTEPGLLRVVVYGAYPIDGDGVLLNLRFTSVGSPGSVSPISFERIMFNEGEAVTVINGEVRIEK